jgi:hypothetical protein
MKSPVSRSFSMLWRRRAVVKTGGTRAPPQFAHEQVVRLLVLAYRGRRGAEGKPYERVEGGDGLPHERPESRNRGGCEDTATISPETER